MPQPTDLPQVLGAILAGGASRRFGSPKALERVGGRRIVDRVVGVMRRVVAEPVIIANQPELFSDLDLPMRGDEVPGRGALSGLHSALLWAGETGRAGALCVASDMPFLDEALLRLILARATAGRAQAVAPESSSKHELEPLCAWYSLSALATVVTRLESGDYSLRSLLAELATERIPLGEVTDHGRPEVIFLNVNTPDDLHLAERIDSMAQCANDSS